MAAGAVHVWRVLLDATSAEIERWSLGLDDHEREAAARKHFERDRNEVVVSHAALRMVLSRYCGAHPSALRFRFGERGKPALAGATPFAFNLSHARGIALIGVAHGREIGVDVEHEDRLRLDDALARRVLTARELDLWRAIPTSEHSRVFLRAWTCKEAVMKASGRGLSMDPRRFDVLSVLLDASDQDVREVRDADDAVWSVRPVDVGEHFHAALAVVGPAALVRAFDLPRAWLE